MTKENLIKILNEILEPMAFKKKGSNWVAENSILFKIVQIQKSNFGNYYYLNFGINLKSINDKTIDIQIFNRLSSQDKNEIKEITSLLTVDSDIPEETERKLLKKYINEKVIRYFETINTEEDVKNSIGKWTSLNVIPLIVKKHFNL